MSKDAVAFVFFNCDEYKSENSMNIFYNHTVFKNMKGSRKALLKKVKDEAEEKRIQIASENFSKVEKLILEGDPAEASQYIQFGAIKAFDCF
ncbi:MAG: hypothetical protein IK062_00095 [Selenomonadaceae bacterium]|nr:hypothetical protein [Selenomonadaceae bacterium]